jgi:flagellar hook-associated protein 1
MSGISQLLETARRALLAQQVGISVTGHNVANASTPGYSRQRVDIVSTPAIRDAAGYIGTGATAVGITRMRNRFIDQQLRASQGGLGNADMRHQIMSQVEATFNEPSTSALGNALTSYFNAWQDLSTHPEDQVARNALMQQGSLVSDAFHRLNSGLTEFRGSLRDEISSKVSRINTLSQEIADIDVQVIAAKSSGASPNDLLDQRDTRIEELSSLANISVSEDNIGSVTISLGSMVIASRAGAVALKAIAGSPATIAGTSFDQMKIVTANSGIFVDATSGELGATLSSYNSRIPNYLGKLDQLASNLISEVNTAHAGGYGGQSPPRTGINFFKGTGAATIGLDLTDTSGGALPGSSPDLWNIAAADPPGSSGNNGVALRIAGLAQQGAAGLGNVSIPQFYNNLVSELGIEVNSADNLTSSNELIVQQLQGQRDATSAVSIDEEMTNLIKFQRAFDAAARLVRTSDDMFQTILTMV